MKKTIIIIISVILGISALAAGVYFAWSKSKEILNPPSISEQQSINSNQLPEQTLVAAKLKIISDQPIFNYWIMSQTATSTVGTSTVSSVSYQTFYFNQNGQILKIKDGEDEIIVAESIDGLQSIKPNVTGKLVLVKYGSFLSPQFSIFNAENKMWQPINNAVAAAFSPDGAKLTYFDKSNNLMIKDLIKIKAKETKIISLNQRDFNLNWLTTEKILLEPKPSYKVDDKIWAIDIKTKTISSFISGKGLMVKWSNDGKLGLISMIARDNNIRLNLIDNKNVTKGGIDFYTSVNKCWLNSQKIYCALPQEHNLMKSPNLPDEYLKGGVYYKDYILSIDIAQNTFNYVLNSNDLAIDAINLSVSDNKLLFINRYDNKLYQLEL